MHPSIFFYQFLELSNFIFLYAKQITFSESDKDMGKEKKLVLSFEICLNHALFLPFHKLQLVTATPTITNYLFTTQLFKQIQLLFNTIDALVTCQFNV